MIKREAPSGHGLHPSPDEFSRDLVITSALDEEGNRTIVGARSHCVRIFRADPTVDEFTSQGGVYWRFHESAGKVKLKTLRGWDHLLPSGSIVMLVRDDEVVRLYTMWPDFRC
ncbi:MAG TPA: hypothetical protein VGN12_17980 [Pirellulales bacterium]